jgi:hypothetical protein
VKPSGRSHPLDDREPAQAIEEIDQPAIVDRHVIARTRSLPEGTSGMKLIYTGRAAGWLVVPDLEPQITDLVPRCSSLIVAS